MKHKEVTFCNKGLLNLEAIFFVSQDQHSRLTLEEPSDPGSTYLKPEYIPLPVEKNHVPQSGRCCFTWDRSHCLFFFFNYAIKIERFAVNGTVPTHFNIGKTVNSERHKSL